MLRLRALLIKLETEVLNRYNRFKTMPESEVPEGKITRAPCGTTMPWLVPAIDECQLGCEELGSDTVREIFMAEPVHQYLVDSLRSRCTNILDRLYGSVIGTPQRDVRLPVLPLCRLRTALTRLEGHGGYLNELLASLVVVRFG
ncbi:hypothetical protein [Amycolatopsis speibonae]|uniref:Uncharacterized protein n=1 Tax=Amycolatopsis speibonae TaxID=1450224 RepID=A0ABV7P3M7_9PSEU